MQITAVTLRNYRVFRDLELEFPPGLVGIYGPNGSGKSSLLESIVWALYGRARTAKSEIRTAKSTGECLVELGFVHDAHHYVVRRSISGSNATVKARVLVGDRVVADGITDVAKYLRSTLGMDETAFRSSVFAEQKQLAAFSDNTPEQRRRLVLQLLGITPIEKARDNARADHRVRTAEHGRLQVLLGSSSAATERLDAARRALADAITEAANAHDDGLAAAAVLAEAEASLELLERSAERAASIRQLGLAARRRLDDANERLRSLSADLDAVDVAAAERQRLLGETPVETVDHEELLLLLGQLREAVDQLARLGVGEVAARPDRRALEQAIEARDRAVTLSAEAKAIHRLATQRCEAARAARDRSELLDEADECPLCGQELAEGFEAIRHHRDLEVDQADGAALAAGEAVRRTSAAASDAGVLVLQQERQFKLDEEAHHRSALAAERRIAAQEAVDVLRSRLRGRADSADETRLRSELNKVRESELLLARLSAQTERRPSLVAERDRMYASVEAAERDRAELLVQHQALGFDADAHRRALASRDTAKVRFDLVQQRVLVSQRSVAAAEQRVHDGEEMEREAIGRDQQLQVLSDEARYAGRIADLLSGFRQVIVGMVGPQLSAHASALFNRLTDGEYDGLEVDPETYEIRVIDGGTPYPSARFSGSEVDLANLAFRVAISEHVRFQAGGQVGLLVLDEALASLDTDRRDRMFEALKHLEGRFRQILVVTHAPEVKEWLPNAIQVQRVGPRQSTARVVESTVESP